MGVGAVYGGGGGGGVCRLSWTLLGVLGLAES